MSVGVGTSHRMLLYHFGSREGLLFQVFALAVRGAPGTEKLLEGLTATWVEDALRATHTEDPAVMRLGVAVTRGLLLDLLAGTPRAEVDAAYEVFVRMAEVSAYVQQAHSGLRESRSTQGGE